MPRPRLLLFALLSLAVAASAQTAPAYRYFRAGNPANIAATPRPGYALMGGGADLDEAFRFLCDRAGGGDLLVLRATGDNEYNGYIQKLCTLNSVATLVIPNREAALDPFVAQAIAHASALFIAGGDQANYINFWQGTPVQSALNNAIRRGVPLGGTSAGLAVMGEYAYTAQGDKPDDPNLDGKTAIADPFGPRITLNRNFLEIPILKGIIADTHFAKRNRMGRLLVFLARLNRTGRQAAAAARDGHPRHRRGAGRGRFAGTGRQGRCRRSRQRLFRRSARRIQHDGWRQFGVMASNKPLTFGPYEIQKVAPGHTFNLPTWTGDATQYKLSVESGVVHSTQPGGGL